LEERLRSRFEWGLLADIQVPDLETRIAILKKKSEDDGITLEDELALFLASHIKSNVRELEGSLIRLHAFASLNAVPLSILLAKDVLKNVLSGVDRVLTVEQVQKLVADYYKIKLADLTGKRRIRSLALPRQVAMYLCRKHVKSSYPEIGHKFGGKDHSTVVHAFSKIQRDITTDSTLREHVETLEQSINR
jgi:chromosomal replication initiator protein